MNAVMRRWPGAEVVFVGPKKNWELFGGAHAPLNYRRDAYLDVWRGAATPFSGGRRRGGAVGAAPPPLRSRAGFPFSGGGGGLNPPGGKVGFPPPPHVEI